MFWSLSCIPLCVLPSVIFKNSLNHLGKLIYLPQKIAYIDMINEMEIQILSEGIGNLKGRKSEAVLECFCTWHTLMGKYLVYVPSVFVKFIPPPIYQTGQDGGK